MATRPARAGPRSWRTTPTTSRRREPLVLGSHMLEICPSIAAGVPSCEIHPLSIGGREDPVRLVFDAAPGPGGRARACSTSATASACSRTRSTSSRRPQPLPRLPVASASWRPRPDFATAAEAWLEGGGPHHTVFSAALDAEALADFAHDRRDRAARDRRGNAAARVPQRAALERRERLGLEQLAPAERRLVAERAARVVDVEQRAVLGDLRGDRHVREDGRPSAPGSAGA